MVNQDAQTIVLATCAFYLLCASYLFRKRKKLLKPGRRWWVRPDIRRKNEGEYSWFVMVRQTNHEQVFSYTGLEDWQFQYLLEMVRPHITKSSIIRPSIPAEMRLAMTLRYLSQGGSFKSIAISWRVGRSTVQAIVNETCDVLWRVVGQQYVRTPTGREWDVVAKDFWTDWQFPNCVGAIDGKHVAMKAPPRCGSEWYNYKGFHSVVLMAACDARYRFLWVDCGGFGSRSDGGLFGESPFGAAVSNETLGLPSPPLPGTNVPHPYCFVADAAFPLRPNIMRPYPGQNLTEEQGIFNYRLSRARRTIENAFGILVSRWGVLRHRLEGSPETVTKIVMASVALHNYCMYTSGEGSPYLPTNFVDREDNGVFVGGRWRNILRDGVDHRDLLPLRGGNATQVGTQCRDTLRAYFSEVAPLEWQRDYVNVGRGFFVE